MQSKAALPCNVQEHPPLSAAVDVAAAAAAAAATIVCAYLCPLCCSGVTLTLALGVPGCCRQQAQVDEATRDCCTHHTPTAAADNSEGHYSRHCVQ